MTKKTNPKSRIRDFKKKDKIEKLKEVTYGLYPDAKTELVYENDFQLLIAIIMSAQTTDKQVNKVNSEFFKILKKPSDAIEMGIEKITESISSIGFYKTKAKNILKTCLILDKKDIDTFEEVEQLIKLNGVGIKTAKVFLSVTKNAPLLGVDTHVHRVLNRVGIVKAKTPEETDKKAEKILSNEDLAKLHHSLIMFGRYHCIARKPKCEGCGLKGVCDYYKKGI